MSAEDSIPSAYASSLFDADTYLYFYSDDYLSSSQTKLEVQFVLNQLQLDATMSVLDLACGHGRHTNAIAPFTKAILGLDLNSQFIELARSEALQMGLENVSFEERDIRTIDFDDIFDRAMLLNTVFGLFDDTENASLLRKVNRSLKFHGLFCLDVINRDTALSQFESDGIVERQGNFLLDRLTFDYESGRMHNSRVYLKDGRRTDAHFSIKLYNYSDIALLLESSGFSIQSAYADWASTPMNFLAKKIVIVARKTRELSRKAYHCAK